jgi:hypothetical protein
MKRMLTVVLMLALTMPAGAAAQVPANVWRSVATKIDVGAEINVRLRGGQRFRATLVEARDASLLLQPRTRVPVPVQEVPYEEILVLERRTKGSNGAAKAIGIGIASGVGGFLLVLAILAATLGD